MPQTSTGRVNAITALCDHVCLADVSCCAAEMMVKAYMTSYKLPCIITRGNNVYGPHQFPEKLVPKFTLLARRGEALPVHGAGQVRASLDRPVVSPAR